MKHEELYYQIVQEANCDELYPILDERLSSVGCELREFNILQEGNFPYVYGQVKTEEVFSAKMIGFFVNINSMVPGYTKPYYYLPVVVFCEDYDDRIKTFVNKKLAIEHEVQHVKDMLELIKQHPEYPETAHRYGLNSITEVEDLATSIDLEISNLFYVEPPAMRADFEKGQRSILMPFDNEAKTVVRYDCDSSDEYVGINMYSYMMTIRDEYKRRFENDETIAKIIDQEIDRALASHGKEVFGRDPIEGLKELRKRSSAKFILAMFARKFV